MDATVKVLRRFHRATQGVVTDPVRVVATSALRDARNSQAFLEWVRSATGWKVEVISGLEEARLIHLGLISNLRVNNAPTLMIDLGGGSCELTVSGRGRIRGRCPAVPMIACLLYGNTGGPPVPHLPARTDARRNSASVRSEKDFAPCILASGQASAASAGPWRSCGS